MTSRVAYNYARALVDLMKERDSLDITREVAEILIQNLDDSEIISFLSHPKAPVGDKKAILKKLAPPEIPQEFLNCLDLIVERGRQGVLVKVLENIVEMVLMEQGFEIVTLISAQPISEAEQRFISEKLEAVWGKKIHLKYRENPNLLGGIIIQRGDKLYDGSLVGRLSEIKESLSDPEINFI